MKCTHCNIEVGSNTKICPLCQSHLVGESEKEYWPIPRDLKHQSMLWKIFLFICLVATALCLFIDFLFIETKHFHWSVIVLAWVVVFVTSLSHFIKCHRSVPRVIFQIMIEFSVMIFATGWYGNFRAVSIDYLMPIVCSITLVINFIFSFIDASFTESSLLYLLLNIGVGVVPYIALYIHRGKAPMAWTISLLISVITFLGLAVFKGKTMISEVQKRLHF